MTEKIILTPKARLAALTALIESAGWKDFEHELATRYERAVKGACDLTKRGRERTGSAGAATELDQIMRHVPALIDSLTRKVDQEKRRVSPKPPG